MNSVTELKKILEETGKFSEDKEYGELRKPIYYLEDSIEKLKSSRGPLWESLKDMYNHKDYKEAQKRVEDFVDKIKAIEVEIDDYVEWLLRDSISRRDLG